MRTFILWTFVLLALPGCGELASVDPWPTDEPDPGTNLVKGSEPRSSVVFCDIEIARHCASVDEIELGLPLARAAVALHDGISAPGNIGLDYSEESRNKCNGGPEAVIFQGPFPQGLPVCVNCGDVLGSEKPYPDADKLCRAQCHDLVAIDPDPVSVPPSPAVIAWCDAHARASTNMTLNGCFADGCSSLGTPIPFLDPRLAADPVDWIDGIDTGNGGGPDQNLTRTSPPDGEFSASAVSSQWMTKSDAWIEFSVNRADRAVTIGLSQTPDGCTSPADCPDTDPGRDNINFGIALGPDGFVYVRVNGVMVVPPGQESWGAYDANARFRITVTEIPPNADGPRFGNVSFARVQTNCLPQNCVVDTFYTHQALAATYPLRLKASFRDDEVVLQDVRMVRVK